MATKTHRNVLLPTISLTPELAEQLDVTLERLRTVRAFQTVTKASLVRELLHRGMQSLETEVKQAEIPRSIPSHQGRRKAPNGKRAIRKTTGTSARTSR